MNVNDTVDGSRRSIKLGGPACVLRADILSQKNWTRYDI